MYLKLRRNLSSITRNLIPNKDDVYFISTNTCKGRKSPGTFTLRERKELRTPIDQRPGCPMHNF